MTCSGDSFYVEVTVSNDDEGTMSGCFADSGETSADDLPVYFRDGEKVDPSFAVYAYDSYVPVSQGAGKVFSSSVDALLLER